MGFLLVLLNSLAVAGDKCIIKNYSCKTQKIHSSMGIYMIINYVFGLIFYGAMSGFKIVPNVLTLVFGFAFAVVIFGLTSSEVMSLRHADVVTAVVFAGCGKVIIPFLFGIVFLKEKVTLLNYIAAIILVIVIILPVFNRQNTFPNAKRSAYFWCLMALVFTGLATVVSKLYVMQTDVRAESVFCFWTNVFLVPYVLISNIRSNGAKNIIADCNVIDKKLFFLLILSAIMINGGNLLCMLALKQLNIVVYTIFCTSLEMGLSALLSRIVYKEKITVYKAVGITGSIVAVILNSI